MGKSGDATKLSNILYSSSKADPYATKQLAIDIYNFIIKHPAFAKEQDGFITFTKIMFRLFSFPTSCKQSH
tara:strand:- start:21514 stop:21726 length:213 start_codon:yes stop_codon:yes gene_type:complete